MSNIFRIDGIIWKIYAGDAKPFCPKHKLEMDPRFGFGDDKELVCAECEEMYTLPRGINSEKNYVLRKLESIDIKKLKVINFDDEAVPLAEDTIDDEKSKFFIKVILAKSKIGKRLVIYAGEKGKREKTQIFVEPDIKRLSFDQNDLHPTDVFLKVEATYNDGSSMMIEKSRGSNLGDN